MHLLCREQMRALERSVLLALSIYGTILTPRPLVSQVNPINVLTEELSARPPGANWLSYNGDYTGRRYTSLSQMTPENVGQLRAQWVSHSTNSDRLEVTPVVVDGLMLVTSANDAYALDARTGRIIWHHQTPTTEGLIDDAAGHHT